VRTAERENRFQNFLAPRALFAGVALAFLACCLNGYRAGKHNCFANFNRFHHFINPTTLFYPTARQVHALTHAQLRRDRIAVVVGGHSILWGSGQSAQGLWTRKLQEQLGDDYRVINLAMNGAYSAEFGGVAAEMVVRDYPRLIFITHAPLTGMPTEEMELGTYRYFLWDAYNKGLLSPDARHLARIQNVCRKNQDDEAFAEQQRGARIDGFVFSRDLWETLEYLSFSTVWCPTLPIPIVHARRDIADPYVPAVLNAVPFAGRYPPEREAALMAGLRGTIDSVRSVVFGINPDGTPYSSASSQGQECPLGPILHDYFPDVLRDRTLLCVLHVSPYYRERLTAEEQGRYYETFACSVPALKQLGYGAVEVGRDYCVMDYMDSGHLSDSGAAKMAVEVAGEVRDFARRLGYVPASEGP
jgi:hypothetical protein